MSNAAVQNEAGTVTASKIEELENQLAELRLRVDTLINTVERLQAGN